MLFLNIKSKPKERLSFPFAQKSNYPVFHLNKQKIVFLPNAILKRCYIEI